MIARSAHTDAVDRPVDRIQWRFEDAEPWHVRIDNGSTSRLRAWRRRPTSPCETTWADWIDVSVRGQDARRAMLRRKLKPRGSLRSWRECRRSSRPGRRRSNSYSSSNFFFWASNSASVILPASRCWSR